MLKQEEKCASLSCLFFCRSLLIEFFLFSKRVVYQLDQMCTIMPMDTYAALFVALSFPVV